MKSRILLPLLVVVFVLAACGPSPEEATTMTASAWTPTPVPPTFTPTPTPIPYDLTVLITDADGVAVSGATVTINGSDPPVFADEDGKAEWTNLPEPDGSMTITSHGYFASEQTFSLSRGPNDLTFTLERDPNGLLPAQACAAGESLLYIEDFQDNKADGWPEIDLHANGWTISEYATEPGNMVASNNSAEHPFSVMDAKTFSDAVWRVRFFVEGRRAISFNWQHNFNFDLDGEHIDDGRYQIVVDTGRIEIRRLTLPVLNIGAAGGKGAPAGAWHNIEMSTYQGDTQVWLDGKRIAGYTDPKPLPGGGIGLELLSLDSSKPDTIIYFDNMSVCGLNAPFISLYTVP